MKKTAAYRVIWISIFSNLILFIIKYIAGTRINSIAVVADAWHSLSDTLTSIVVIAGFWIASKPPDKEHPYGHGRAESIAAIIVATLLGMIALNFIVDSFERISGRVAVHYGYFAMAALLATVVVKETLAQYSMRIGKKLNSPALIADGWHHRSDSISSGAILLGALLAGSFWWIDGVMGLMVAALLLQATYTIMKSSVSSILGEKPTDEMVDNMKKAAYGVHPEITDIHNVKVHSYGDYHELMFDMRLPPDMAVDNAHNIATDVEKAIYKDLDIRSTVHIEPYKENNSKYL